MRRSAFLPAMLAVVAVLPLDGEAGEAARPNIVFMLCDDLGYGDLSCFGSQVIKTPNLDRLAAEGLKLAACYAGAPVCSPSRAAFMTGRIANRSGIRDWIPPNSGIYLRREETTVAELLRQAGYRTALVGKWHLSSTLDGSEPTPADHGFDHWFATQNNARPSHEHPVNFVRNGEPVGRLEGNSSTLIVDEALRFIGNGGQTPFALFVWFHAPHEPVNAPDEFTAMYDHLPDPNKREYCGSVTLVDHEVGRLLAGLDEQGLRHSTLVLFASDNGPETRTRYRGAERSHGSPGPLRGMKLHMHEGGYRVPGIMSWPGKTPAGAVCHEPVAAVDLLPTACELAGIDLPNQGAVDGTSLLAILEGRPLERSTPLYWQYDRAIGGPWRVALRQGPYKLLADAELEQFALFDLANDPAETRDLAADEPQRVRDLAAVMSRIHASVEADARLQRPGSPESP